MAAEKDKVHVPPYVPYSTFRSFINGLASTGIPSHIDRSIMDKMSGSGQSAMIATLKSLNLVNDKLEPTKSLEVIVTGSENDFSTTLSALIKNTYPFLFDGSINIEKATSKKIEDKFRDAGASGSTLTKCISFFLTAAKAANIPVSPHVKAPKLQRSSTPAKKKAKAHEKNEVDNNFGEEFDSTPEGMEKITISLPGMDDGIVYFPANMTKEQADLAVKMTKFILNNYYGIKSND